MIALVAALLSAGDSTSPRRIDVGPNETIHSISAAVSSAPSGSTIVIHAGVYHEPTIVIARPLTLVGSGPAILDGDNRREILIARADDVTIRGLSFRNVGSSFVDDRAAIRVASARGCTIADNRIDDGFFGIYLSNVTDCRIEHNTLRAHARSEAAAGNGIHLWSSRRITIAGNSIAGHRDGIYFEFVHNSHVANNLSTGNLRYGMHFMYSDDCEYVHNVFQKNGSGVAVMYTKHVEMTGNTFADNWGSASYGLLLKEIADAHLVDNVFRKNTTGLLADGTTRLVARHNEFTDNGWALKLDANTLDGQFTANNFAGNTFDVATNGASHTTVFAGNYWASYRGYDLDRDGVGDVPHRPVRLFSMIVQQNQPALLLLRSALVDVLDAGERALPALTPDVLADQHPAMRRIP